MVESNNDSFANNEVTEKKSGFEEVKADYFSYKGRLNREKFVVRTFSSTIIFGFVILVCYSISNLIGIINLKNNLMTYLLLGAFFAIWLLANVSLGVRRAHDLNRSGKWYLWVVAFFITILLHLNSYTMISLSIDVIIALFFIYCYCFYKGTVGENKYGKDQVNVPVSYNRDLKLIAYLALISLFFNGINMVLNC